MRELAIRLMRSSAWRWMPGMATTAGRRVLGADEQGSIFGTWAQGGNGVTKVRGDELPDLRDPATLGCLLALVRELHREPLAVAVAYIHHEYQSSRIAWSIEADGAPLGDGGAHDSEAEALVASLEAASVRTRTPMLTITAADALAALEEAGGGE